MWVQSLLAFSNAMGLCAVWRAARLRRFVNAVIAVAVIMASFVMHAAESGPGLSPPLWHVDPTFSATLRSVDYSVAVFAFVWFYAKWLASQSLGRWPLLLFAGACLISLAGEESKQYAQCLLPWMETCNSIFHPILVGSLSRPVVRLLGAQQTTTATSTTTLLEAAEMFYSVPTVALFFAQLTYVLSHTIWHGSAYYLLYRFAHLSWPSSLKDLLLCRGHWCWWTMRGGRMMVEKPGAV
jgi:hypothetical protein